MTPAQSKMDTELWGRFMEKLIEQTESGTLSWEMRYTGEYARYAVCVILDRQVWFCGLDSQVEVVEPNGMRWTVLDTLDETTKLWRIKRLRRAIGASVSPDHAARVQQFAREFLGEVPP